MSKRALILVNDPVEPEIAPLLEKVKPQGHVIYSLPYVDLMGHIQSVRDILESQEIDFILFGRNDQVYNKVNIGPFIRALEVGYSTFSGIDEDHVLHQTVTCLTDFLDAPVSLDLPHPTSTGAKHLGDGKTFSLIFDMEQLAGVRYGLPRILSLLERYDAKATFYVTNFVDEIYPDAIPTLLNHGHELGLHGHYHEYLAGHSVDDQSDCITSMINAFGVDDGIESGNFIYRMDHNTINAMCMAGLSHFVVFMEHLYRPFRYIERGLHPFPVWTEHGMIHMVPISVETYDRDWARIRGMIEASLRSGKKQDSDHISILMHPFRDGSEAHINSLEKLLEYLKYRGFQSLRIKDVVNGLSPVQPDCAIYYDAVSDLAGTEVTEKGWVGRESYEQRISKLFHDLKNQEHNPVLCLSMPEGIDQVYGVFPVVPNQDGQVLSVDDPINWQWKMLPDALQKLHEPDGTFVFKPESGQRLLGRLWQMRPRTFTDITGLVPEARHRLRYYSSKLIRKFIR